MSEFLSFVMPTATVIATALAAFALYRTGILKIVTDERNIYRDKSERLESENGYYRKKIEEIERRLERYELIFQGRDPETVAAFNRFAEVIDRLIDRIETRCLGINYTLAKDTPRPRTNAAPAVG